MDMPCKFGMFVHFGLYALTGYHEQVRWRLNIPREDYRKLAEHFTLERFDPDAWVRLAKDAGMEYLCVTTKHHDGFCMFATETTDFNITNTPYGRDFLAELADACRRGGLRLSLYYSNPDWDYVHGYNSASSHQMHGDWTTENIEQLKEFQKRQIRELLTNYGDIYTFFWDIPTGREDPSMNEFVRSLQPGILINNRGWNDPGDFSTPEREVPAGGVFERFTEACQSVGRQSWGYCADEDYFTSRFLTAGIDSIRARHGSYLLNIGPAPDGTIPEKAASLVRRVGDWYNRVRESFEGEPYELPEDRNLLAVRNRDVLYIHLPNGTDACGLTIHSIRERPHAVTLLNDGRPLRFDLAVRPEDVNRFLGRDPAPTLHLFDFPAEEFYGETMVIRIHL